MCILPDFMLESWASSGGIIPFDADCINPASVDLKWSGRYRVALHQTHGRWNDIVLQHKFSGEWSEVIEVDYLSLEPGEFYLLDTADYISLPNSAAGILALKSSMGRLGLEHLHAGFVDPGFKGTLTLEVEMRAPWNLVIAKYQPIVQLVLERMVVEPLKAYQGKYVGQRGPTVAR